MIGVAGEPSFFFERVFAVGAETPHVVYNETIPINDFDSRQVFWDASNVRGGWSKEKKGSDR